MIGDLFTLLLVNPMVNLLVILNNVLFGSFGLAIIAFTIIIRAITFPLTLRQLHSTRAMQSIQPRIQEIQKKYSDPKRRQQEIMAVYREAGVNPLGCIGPFFLQFPILIALFFAVRYTLPESPEALERLSGHLYPWSYIQQTIPISEHFLGMDLRNPNIILIVLVGLTTWLQSKTTVTVAQTAQQRQQQQMMTIMMPVIFTFFALNFPSGVSLYWVVSALVSIGFNIVTYGLPMLGIQPLVQPPARPAAASAATAASGGPGATREPRTTHGQQSGRSKRQNRRRRS